MADKKITALTDLGNGVAGEDLGDALEAPEGPLDGEGDEDGGEGSSKDDEEGLDVQEAHQVDERSQLGQ